MKIALFFFTVCLIIGSFVLCPAQASFEDLPHSTSLTELAAKSQLIVIGTARKESWVLDPQKWKIKVVQKSPTEASTELPNTKDALKGPLVGFEVHELLKGDGRARPHMRIPIFSYGLMRQSPPPLREGEVYIMFLTPLRADQVADLQGLVIHDPGKGKADSPFNPKRAYTFVSFHDSVVSIDSSSAELIQRIKKQVRSSASKSSHKRY